MKAGCRRPTRGPNLFPSRSTALGVCVIGRRVCRSGQGRFSRQGVKKKVPCRYRKAPLRDEFIDFGAPTLLYTYLKLNEIVFSNYLVYTAANLHDGITFTSLQALSLGSVRPRESECCCLTEIIQRCRCMLRGRSWYISTIRQLLVAAGRTPSSAP